MNLTCPACSTPVEVDVSRVPADGCTVQCSECAHSFLFFPPKSADARLPVRASSSGGAFGRPSSLNTRYFIKRPTGKIFGPFDVNAIRTMLDAGKLSIDAQVSPDQTDWQGLAEVEAFVDLVAQIASGDSGPALNPGFGRPSPGGTMLGAWIDSEESAISEVSEAQEIPELPRPAAPQLPRSAGGLNLPTPPRLPGLPTPGLPAPRREGAADAQLPKRSALDLPSLRAGLPKPRAARPPLPGLAADLPAPASGLPQRSAGLPQRSAGLPQRSAELPGARAEDSLPQPRGYDLPGQMGDANLPAMPTQEVESWTQKNDVFGDASLDDDLFSHSNAEDELFGDQGVDDDLFDSAQAHDDLFGEHDDAADSLFDAPVERSDDLFSDAPSQQYASLEADAAGFEMDGALRADAFGAQDDDLFDAPGSADDDFDDDLFAAPGLAEESDDLFEPGGLNLGESSGALGEEDDFLSDNNNFTFLDEPSQPSHDDLAGMSGEWGDDLMSDAPAIDAFDSGRHDDDAGWDEDAWEAGATASSSPRTPDFAAETPDPDYLSSRQPASRGIESPAGPQASDAADKKRSTMAIVGVSLVGAALVGGLSFGIYNSFFSAEVDSAAPVVVQQKSGPARVDLQGIQSDTYGDLHKLIDNARRKKVSAEDLPKLLLSESLLLARYEDADIRKHAESLAQPLAQAAGGWQAVARGAFEAQNANADAARSYLEPLVGEAGEVGYYAQLMMGIGDVLALEEQFGQTANKPDAPAQAAAEEGSADSADPTEQAARRIAARGTSALEAAEKLQPDAPAPKYWRARLLAQTGQPDAAIELWQSALQDSESHVASSVKLGRLFYEQGDLNRASQALSGVTEQFESLAAPDERASAFHLLGMIHVARQESDEAIQALTTALSVDVGRSDTIQALAEQYMAAEKYQEALNFFTTNKNLGAENPDVMLGIVRAHMGLEKWDVASEELQRGAKLFPEDARFPLYLGRLHRDRLAYFDAQKALTQALKIDPSLLSAHAALAQLIWITDKDQQAADAHIKTVEAQPERISAAVGTEVAQYYQMSGQRDLAEARYAQTLERHPNYWPARLALARLYLDSQENEKALSLLERAKAVGVKDLRLSAYLADAYRQSRHFPKAVDQINVVIAEHADNPQYIFIRGRIYFDQGNFDNAREDFIKAYELDTRFHQAYFYLGRTAFAQQDYSGALKIFRHVLDYQPNSGEFHYWMGRAYEAEKRLNSALDEYRKATVVDEAFGQKNPEIFVRRGELLSKLGYSQKGKADIAEALRIAPDMVEALVAMGASNYRDKLYEEAIANFQSALKLNAELPDVQYKLGMALMYTNREVQGAEHLQLAVRYGHEDPEIFQTLGYLYKRMNRKQAAIDAFKKYLTLVAEKQSVSAGAKREIIQQIGELGGRL